MKKDDASGDAGLFFKKGEEALENAEYSEAFQYLQKAVDKDPKNLFYQHALGRVLALQGRWEDAGKTLKAAHHLQPDFSDKSLGEEYLQRAFLELAAVSDSLGKVYQNLNNAVEAVNAHYHAISLSPENDQYWIHFSEAMRSVEFSDPSDTIKEAIMIAFSKDFIDYQNLSKPGCSILRQSREFNKLLNAQKKNDLLEFVKEGKAVPALQDLLWKKLLENTISFDEKIENVLISLRRILLDSITDDHFINGSLEACLGFLYSLALYNFMNGYAHTITTEEEEKVEALLQSLEGELGKGGSLVKAKIAMIASYRPLHDLEEGLRGELLDLASVSEKDFWKLAKRQVEDVLQEQNYAKDIPKLGDIEDGSFNESPHPRWRGLAMGKAKPLAFILKEQFPFKEGIVFVDGKGQRVLIAGCGTGKDAINAALLYQGAHIVAADISVANLAYARRKANKYSVNNIEFFHSEISNLKEIDQNFDVIECTAEDGKILFPLLKGKGWMRLACKDIEQGEEILHCLNLEFVGVEGSFVESWGAFKGKYSEFTEERFQLWCISK